MHENRKVQSRQLSITGIGGLYGGNGGGG